MDRKLIKVNIIAHCNCTRSVHLKRQFVIFNALMSERGMAPVKLRLPHDLLFRDEGETELHCMITRQITGVSFQRDVIFTGLEAIF